MRVLDRAGKIQAKTGRFGQQDTKRTTSLHETETKNRNQQEALFAIHPVCVSSDAYDLMTTSKVTYYCFTHMRDTRDTRSTTVGDTMARIMASKNWQFTFADYYGPNGGDLGNGRRLSHSNGNGGVAQPC